ncbi:Metal-dependent phosphohydrolase [hydrothermal vent metagenome]|uniref:Metal-dependent phosphohydrolase n=1 Tax=hydrothermal vent metagenome TaxID=652676 RepID=A0A3B0R1T4_9ZZZZ
MTTSTVKLGEGFGNSKARILAVDDNIQNVELLEGLLSSRGYEVVKAYNGMEALKRLEEGDIDVVLLDVLMPKMDGYETCRRIKSRPETRLLPVIMLTALDSIEDKIKGIEAGADDFITKPFQKPELLARVKSFERLKGLLDELENAQNVLFSLASALDYNDPYTHGHSKRVSEFSVRLAAHIGLDEAGLDAIRNAGVLHDIGKIATDKGILHKPGALNAIEYKHVKDHPVVGEQICKPLKFARPLLPIIRHHHEKYDGSGYPDGLVGEDIPLGARIMAIVDVYDALTSVRPYRSDIPPEVALEVMKAEAIKGYWDKGLLDAFCEVLRKDGYTISG